MIPVVFTNPDHVMLLLIQMISTGSCLFKALKALKHTKPTLPFTFHIISHFTLHQTPKHRLHLFRAERPLLSLASTSAPAASSTWQDSTLSVSAAWCSGVRPRARDCSQKCPSDAKQSEDTEDCEKIVKNPWTSQKSPRRRTSKAPSGAPSTPKFKSFHYCYCNHVISCIQILSICRCWCQWFQLETWKLPFFNLQNLPNPPKPPNVLHFTSFHTLRSTVGREAILVPGVHLGPRRQQHPADLRVHVTRRPEQRGGAAEEVPGVDLGLRRQQHPADLRVAFARREVQHGGAVEVLRGHGAGHRPQQVPHGAEAAVLRRPEDVVVALGEPRAAPGGPGGRAAEATTETQKIVTGRLELGWNLKLVTTINSSTWWFGLKTIHRFQHDLNMTSTWPHAISLTPLRLLAQQLCVLYVLDMLKLYRTKTGRK